MAYTVNTGAFITMFGDEVHHSFQQLESKLQGSVRTVRGVVGHTYQFPVLGKGGVIKNKTATEDLDAMSSIGNTAALTGGGTWYGDANVTMAHTNVTANINTYATGEYIDDFDSLKTNIDLRNAYAESIAGAMNRAVDGEIISAFDAIANADLAGGAQIDATAGTLGKTEILTAKRYLDAASVPQSDRFLVVNPLGLNELMNTSTIVSSDFGVISNEALQTGNIGQLFGFNIIMSNELTGTLAPNSGISCYAFHKNAVGCAVGKEMTTMVNYVPQKLSTLISAEYLAGATAVDSTGVVRITVA